MSKEDLFNKIGYIQNKAQYDIGEHRDKILILKSAVDHKNEVIRRKENRIEKLEKELCVKDNERLRMKRILIRLIEEGGADMVRKMDAILSKGVESGKSFNIERKMEDDVYLAIWENHGYLPDPVADAFREALVKASIDLCHECGTQEATVEFCAETIRRFLRQEASSE